MFAVVGVVWAVTGISLLLGLAILRLAPITLEALAGPFYWHHWLALVVVVALMAFAEGYRGFQRAFSPRFGARCRYLFDNPTPARVLLAPFFCMGYFDATRRRQISSILLTLMIIVLIVIVQHTPQPWRGIIDAGVCVGLIWGLGATNAYVVLAFTAKDYAYSPEIA